MAELVSLVFQEIDCFGKAFLPELDLIKLGDLFVFVLMLEIPCLIACVGYPLGRVSADHVGILTFKPQTSNLFLESLVLVFKFSVLAD